MAIADLLQLMRIPNVFTAVANVAAGILLVRGGHIVGADAILLAASACLYVCGMVLNDYFDRDIDALERPGRPIPSGRIAPALALGLGASFMAAGVALATVHSPISGAVAAALACFILLYDGALKGGPLGPMAMGACRFVNVCLGLSVLGTAPAAAWFWVAPCTMGLYTVVLTSLSRSEVGGGDSHEIRRVVAQLVWILGVAVVALATIGPALSEGHWLLLAPFAALVAWRSWQLFRPLLADPDGATVGRAIGGGIVLMPVIDACMVAAAGHLLAALWVAALALPALALKRRFYMT